MKKKGVKMAKINNESANCLIGEGSVFEGRFYVNGSIEIEGTFQGEIKTDDQLVVGPGGKVKTNIQAKKVVIAGTIIGNIYATEEVSLLQTGKVLGNITTPKLNVEPGVVAQGKVTITSSTADGDVNKVIEESYGADAEEFFGTLNKNGKTALKKMSVKEKEV